jgi:hypothetical protein
VLRHAAAHACCCALAPKQCQQQNDGKGNAEYPKQRAFAEGHFGPPIFFFPPTPKNCAGSRNTREITALRGMDHKIDRLLTEVERLLLHVGHHIPPETVAVDDLRKLVAEIRQERDAVASDGRFGGQSAPAESRQAGEALKK